MPDGCGARVTRVMMGKCEPDPKILISKPWIIVTIYTKCSELGNSIIFNFVSL